MKKKITKNIIWLCADKGIRLIAGIYLLGAVAKDLGPSIYGDLIIAISAVTLFSALGSSSLQNIIVDHIIKDGNKKEILIPGIILSILGAIFGCIFSLITSVITNNDIRVFYITLIISISLPIQSIWVLKYWFEANMENKIVVNSELASFIICGFIKMFLIKIGASVYYFALSIVLEATLTSIFIYIAIKSEIKDIKITSKIVSNAKLLLKKSWPIICSSLLIALYMEFDKFMISRLLGSEKVGIYAAGVRICQIFYIFPAIILSVLYPILTGYSNKYINWNNIGKLIIIMGIFNALLLSIFSEEICTILYGNNYIESAEVIKITSWTILSVGIGTVWTRWIIHNENTIMLLKSQVITALLTITLDFILIPEYGIIGGSWSLLISAFIALSISFTMYKPKESWALIIGGFNFGKRV